MDFDINETIADMLNAIKNASKNHWKFIQDTANTYLQNKKDRLELLSSMRIKNQISNEFFLERLKDEKSILNSELHSIAIITKAMAQAAANAAIDVLQKAIIAAVRI